MASFMVICRKELSDHLGSKRFLLLFALIMILALLSAYQGAESIRNNSSGLFINIFSGYFGGGFAFTYLMFFFGPILGLALGFDAINREKSQGSLSVILSQPIFRDSVINGKFLAGICALSLLVVSTVGIMSGVAIPLLGFGPGLDELVRIVLFTLVTILYTSVWLAIGLLFSTLTKKTTTSILLSVSTWLFSVVAISLLAMLIATIIVPNEQFIFSGSFDQSQMDSYQQRMDLRHEIYNTIQRISPSTLYQEAAATITTVSGPVISSGVLISYGSSGAQDLASIWPHITVLAVVLVVCFAASYMLFLRKEIRSGR